MKLTGFVQFTLTVLASVFILGGMYSCASAHELDLDNSEGLYYQCRTSETYQACNYLEPQQCVSWEEYGSWETFQFMKKYLDPWFTKQNVHPIHGAYEFNLYRVNEGHSFGYAYLFDTNEVCLVSEAHHFEVE